MKSPFHEEKEIAAYINTIAEGDEVLQQKLFKRLSRIGVESSDLIFKQTAEVLLTLIRADESLAPLKTFLSNQEATLLAIQRQIESDSKNFQNRANQFLLSAEKLQNTVKMNAFGGGQSAPLQRTGVVPTPPNNSFGSLLQAAVLGAVIASVITSFLFIYVLRQGGFTPQKHSTLASPSQITARLP